MEYLDTYVQKVNDPLTAVGQKMIPTAQTFIARGDGVMVPVFILLDADGGVEMGGLVGPDAIAQRVAQVQAAIQRHPKTVNGFIFLADVLIRSGKMENGTAVQTNVQDALLCLQVDRWGRMTTVEIPYTRDANGVVTWEESRTSITPLDHDVHSPWTEIHFPVKEGVS